MGNVLTFGKAQKGTLNLKSSINYLDSKFDNIFAILSEHKFSHLISCSSNGIGLISFPSLDKDIPFIKSFIDSIQDHGHTISPNLDFNELQTEYFATKFLEKNFGDVFQYKKFAFLCEKENGTIEKSYIYTNCFNYKESARISEVLNILFDKDLKKAYLDNNNSLEKILNSKKYNDIKKDIYNLRNTYHDYIQSIKNYSTPKETLSEKMIDNLNNSLYKVIKSFDKNIGISSDKYDKLYDALSKNPIYIGDSKISVNDVFIATLNLERSNLNLLEKKDIKSVLEGNADKLIFSDYYDFFGKKENNPLCLNSNIKSINVNYNKDILLDKDKGFKSKIKLSKDSSEFYI